MILSTRKSVKYMLLKNDIITQKILIDNFIYAVTYQDGNFILHHDQLLSPAYVDIVSIAKKAFAIYIHNKKLNLYNSHF